MHEMFTFKYWLRLSLFIAPSTSKLINNQKSIIDSLLETKSFAQNENTGNCLCTYRVR